MIFNSFLLLVVATISSQWQQQQLAPGFNFLLPWVQEHHRLFIDTTTRELHCVYGLWICTLHSIFSCKLYLSAVFKPVVCTLHSLALWSSACVLRVACTLPGIEACLEDPCGLHSLSSIEALGLYLSVVSEPPPPQLVVHTLMHRTLLCGLHVACTLSWFEAFLAGLFSLWATASSS